MRGIRAPRHETLRFTLVRAMTSAEIRQSFLDFFREKQHTIVPSSSLLPDAPNLLFTNAGMNQFVPIFLGQTKAAVESAARRRHAEMHPRRRQTQRPRRRRPDTYHHTFFEMLGNWSFGDYFKKEAIDWAWELVVERWKFPPQRLYATVYKPGPGRAERVRPGSVRSLGASCSATPASIPRSTSSTATRRTTSG